MQPFVALEKKLGGPEKSVEAISETAEDLGLKPDPSNQTLVALALCRAGEPEENVVRMLDWREFESFCGGLLRAWGYTVKENVLLKKPRAQLDLVAIGESVVLSVDCKHWKRDHNPSILRQIARKQLGRSKRLREVTQDYPPIASAIFTFSQGSGSFVDGVAVVPVRTIRDFLSRLESFLPALALR